jgi:hypothetical protein
MDRQCLCVAAVASWRAAEAGHHRGDADQGDSGECAER